MKKFLTKSQVQSLIVENKCSYYYEDKKRIMHVLGATSKKCVQRIEEMGYDIPFALLAQKTVATYAEIAQVIHNFHCTHSIDKGSNTIYIFGKNALLCEKELYLMGEIPYTIRAKAIQLV